MKAKKAFTLVELLVAMAIIAILLGLAVFGITIVQQNARDTQRRSKVNDVEIALAGQLAAGNSLPTAFTVAANAGNTATAAYVNASLTVQLPAPLSRGATPFTNATNTAQTNYCYGVSGSLYVVGVSLEGGGVYFKSNSGATYSAFGAAPTGTGPTCVDADL